jgi:hypothetical protein
MTNHGIDVDGVWKKFRPRYAAWALAVLVATLGLWARFVGLADRPLAVDEYYFLVSTESVLADGLPDLPGGGYYTRGILIQYLTAAAIAVTGNTMLALTLIPTLFGLGCVALAFFYGTQVGGRRLGVCLAVLLFLSSWHVEFSRFGRMYAPFQFFTLLFFIGYFWTLEGRGGWRRYVPPLAVLLAIATHELTMLLLPLLFVPVLLPGRLERFGRPKAIAMYGVASSAVAALCLWQFLFLGARTAGVEAPMPADWVPGPAAAGEVGRFLVPAFAFWRIAEGPLDNLVAVVAAMGLVAALLLALRKLRPGLEAAHVVAATAVVAAALHQLSLAGLLVLFAVFHYRSLLFQERFRGALLGLAAAASIAIAWLGYATLSTYVLDDRSWIGAAGERVFRMAVFRTFFAWPDFYVPTLSPWLAEAPILTALLLPALLLSAWWRGSRPIAEIARGPGFAVMYTAVLFGVLAQDYHTTRYWFFVYPMLLAVLLLAGSDAAERIARARSWTRGGGQAARAFGLAGAAVLFSLTDDFNPLHLLNVGTADVTYRTGGYERYEAMWYSRDDIRSPAHFVNERVRSGNGDAAVIVADVPQASYYLDAPHAVFYARDSDRFPRVSRKGGTVDLWSGQRLLSTDDDVREYADGQAEVWILRSVRYHPFDVDSVWGEASGSVERSYLGPDGFAEVLHLDLRGSP